MLTPSNRMWGGGVLDRKLRRELWAARGMLSAIAGIIAIGITCFVAMVSSYLNLELARRSYYARCRMADFSIELKKLPLAELDRLDGIRGITEYHPRITSEVTIDLDEVQRPISGRVISLPEQPAPVINRVLLERGEYFSGSRREEVIVSSPFARQRNIRPGDSIHVILNNRRQELFVTGTAISSEFVYLLAPGSIVPDAANYAVLYVPRTFAEEAFDMEGACNQVVGLLDAAYRDRPQRVLDEAEARLEPFGVFTTTPRSEQLSHLFLSSEIRGLRVMAIVLPTIFLLVAALILNVLMMRVAEQQRTVIGTLKALGYRNGELLWHFLKYGTRVGLAGGLLGTLLGYTLAGVMITVYRHFFELPRLINRPYPLVLLAGVAISVLFSLAGTLRGLLAVLRLAPAEAMRPKPPRRGRRVLLEKWRWFWRRLDFRWQIVLRNIFRHRMRTLAGLFAATIGAALIFVTFQMRDAMNEMLEFQFEKVLLSDFDVALKDQRDFGAVYEARRFPGVDYVEPQYVVPCTFRNGNRSKQGAITGILPSARLTVPRDMTGQRVRVPESGLLLTRPLAETLDISPGERITVHPVQGLREPLSVPVTAVVDSYLGLSAYADFSYLNHLRGEEASVTSLGFKLRPGRDATRAFYGALKETPAVQGVSAVRDDKQKLADLLVQQMLISNSVVILFAGLTFFGSVLNASLISLAERQTEIATLRVVGYTTREVGAIFLRESVCLNLLGAVLGLPLGYWLSLQIGRMVDTDIFRLPHVVQPTTWLIPILAGVLFTLLAHIPVRRAIERMDWLSALNVKE